MDKAALHIDAIAFIHRFGSSLNGHVHFNVCVVDGVFAEVAGSPIFQPDSAIDAAALAQVQVCVSCLPSSGGGLLESCQTKDMLVYQHSGFSVDAGVRDGPAPDTRGAPQITHLNIKPWW